MLKRLCALGLLLAVVLAAATAAWAAPEEQEGQTLTILFTHDTHDHWLPAADGAEGEYGGYVRLATMLKEQREIHPNALTLDGGDFSMGSLYQTIYSSDAPELKALGAMGYDVTTLGNHEFDYRASGLADMLLAAATSDDPTPAIVQANYHPSEEDEESWKAWNAYGITDYVLIERGGVTTAVFGLLGVDADECAPMSGMEFEPIAEAAERVVEEIRAEADPDFIVCLSHSGTDGNGEGEDYELAKAVDGIDVIISGHTHTTLEEPVQVNDTLIVSAGAYTRYLGVLTVVKDEGGALTAQEYELLPVDETVAEDPSISAMAEEYQTVVEENYLSQYGMTFDQVLAVSSFDFTPIEELGEVQEDEALGNLIADSYIYAVKQAEGEDYVPVDFAVVASGVIRASLAKGDITVSDVFDVSSLGIGADGTPGYPLISVWITGKELKDAFEVDASVTPLMSAAQLYPSGMTWTFNPNRMIFNKVTYCAQVTEDGTEIPLEDDKLYRVVTGLYSGQMLGTVNDKSFGILTITPKDAQGQVVEDMEAQIIHNSNGSEVKEWYALASYLESLGNVPLEYATQMNRKVVSPSWNPIELLKSPNLFTILAVVVVLAVLAVIVLLFRFLLRLVTGGGRRSSRGRGYRGRRRR